MSAELRGDAAYTRARSDLLAGKYRRMSESAYGYYRGTLAVYRRDWEANELGLSETSFSEDGVLPAPLSIGDPHPENFGVLRARDGSHALELNDFDSADRAPYLWDLRRLAAGLDLAARLANPDDPVAAKASTAAAPDVAEAVARGYAEAMAKLATGAPRARVTDAGADVIVEDLFSRSDRDVGLELMSSTTLTNGARRFLRGVLDPTAPDARIADLPAWALAALPDTLARYRDTLVSPPALQYFTMIDAVRVLGSGVASWPKVRIALLLRGPTDAPDDDVIVELKELSTSGLVVMPAPEVAWDSEQARVLGGARHAWAMPDADPLWGTSDLRGLPCQIKRESEGQKTMRVGRLTGKRGTPAVLTTVAHDFGAVLARAHAGGEQLGSTARIAALIARDPAGFAREQRDVGDRYAQRVLADFPLFLSALVDLGPTLGMTLEISDVPPPDLAQLYEGL